MNADRHARNRRALALVLATAAVCAVALALRGAPAARAELDGARASHAAVLAQARRVAHLRQEREHASDRPQSAPDLIARFSEQMQRAGVAAGALGQLRVGAAERLGDTGYQRQAVFVSVEGVRPDEFARLLLGWRRAEPLWTVRDLRLTHRARETSDRYDAALTLESIAVAQRAAPTGSTPPATKDPAP